MTNALARYTVTDAKIAEWRAAYAGRVFDCTTADGLACAVIGRAELRAARVAVEAERAALKRPILEAGRELDAEAARVTAAIVLLEDPIDAAIKGAEAAKLAEKAAKRAAEIARIRAETEAAEKIERERQAAAIREQREKLDAEIEAARAEREAARLERVRLDEAAAAVRLEADRIAGEERARLRRIAHEEAEAARLEREKAAQLAAQEDARRRRIEEDDRAATARRLELERFVEAGRAELDKQVAGTAALIKSLPPTLLQAADLVLELLDGDDTEQRIALASLRDAVARERARLAAGPRVADVRRQHDAERPPCTGTLTHEEHTPCPRCDR